MAGLRRFHFFASLSHFILLCLGYAHGYRVFCLRPLTNRYTPILRVARTSLSIPHSSRARAFLFTARGSTDGASDVPNSDSDLPEGVEEESKQTNGIDRDMKEELKEPTAKRTETEEIDDSEEEQKRKDEEVAAAIAEVNTPNRRPPRAKSSDIYANIYAGLYNQPFKIEERVEENDEVENTSFYSNIYYSYDDQEDNDDFTVSKSTITSRLDEVPNSDVTTSTSSRTNRRPPLLTTLLAEGALVGKHYYFFIIIVIIIVIAITIITGIIIIIIITSNIVVTIIIIVLLLNWLLSYRDF